MVPSTFPNSSTFTVDLSTMNSETKEFQWCIEWFSYKSSPDAYHSGVPPSHSAEGSQSSTADICRVWCHCASSCANAGFQHCHLWKCICDSGRQCLEGNATASADIPLLEQHVLLNSKETKKEFNMTDQDQGVGTLHSVEHLTYRDVSQHDRSCYSCSWSGRGRKGSGDLSDG